jgi:predicted RNase H-like nuclease
MTAFRPELRAQRCSDCGAGRPAPHLGDGSWGALRTRARPSSDLRRASTPRASVARHSTCECHAVIVVGIDLAWGEGSSAKAANETGVVVVDPAGSVVDAGWTCGLDETIEMISRVRSDDVLLMIDAPLVVENPTGQRLCEKQVGQRYGRWKVSANSTNLASPRLAGQILRIRLEALGWTYESGGAGPPSSGLIMSECYPYATLVGATELGYDVERPIYKRKPKTVATRAFRQQRAAACDDLVRRVGELPSADPAIDIRSHAVTRRLSEEPSPIADVDYKHREDLIDAAICAWTGLVWVLHGTNRCQVLGDPGIRSDASIIALARPEQRR